MTGKDILITFYGQDHVRPDWKRDMTGSDFKMAITELADDLRKFGINLRHARNEEIVIKVNSYGDLLNAVKISSPADNIGNLCIGHIIDKSPNLDLLEDLKRAVKRVAFAPETIAPEAHNRKVCHNCGCGC